MSRELLSDERFFASGPAISYRPNSVNVARLAPPPREAPPGDPKPPVAADSPVERSKRAIELKRAIQADKETCPHPRFTRIGAWNPKNGVERVRARCTACGKEKIKAATELPPTYNNGYPKA